MDVLYNWIDSNIMKFSSSRKPFCVAKEMHALMLQALIRTCSKLGSFVIDFAASIGIYYFKLAVVAFKFHSGMFFNICFFVSNNVLAYRNLGQHLLISKVKRISTRFKTKGPGVKSCQNTPWYLIHLSISSPRLFLDYE